MSAVANAEAGLIRRVQHEGLREPDLKRAERVQALTADQVMKEMAGVLDQPTYEGNVDIALAHYMRREAFSPYNQDFTEAYIELSEQIGNNSDGTAPVPVLFRYPDISGAKKGNTSLVMVDPEQPFRSAVQHKRDVEKPGFTGRVSIARRSLSLIGETTILGADLFSPEEIVTAPPPVREEELILDQKSQVDGRNRKLIPAEHVFSNTSQEITRYDDAFGEYTVGWEGIGEDCEGSLYNTAYLRFSPTDNIFLYAFKMRHFFETSGTLGTLTAATRSLKAVFDHAEALQRSLGNLAHYSE